MSKILEFVDASNDFRYFLMSHITTSYELYSKISCDYWRQLCSDPNIATMYDYSNYRDRKDGCIGELFGVKLIVCDQEHDYEFLIKI